MTDSVNLPPNSRIVGQIPPEQFFRFRAEQGQLDAVFKQIGMATCDLVARSLGARQQMQTHASLLEQIVSAYDFDPETTRWSIDGAGQVIVQDAGPVPETPEE